MKTTDRLLPWALTGTLLTGAVYLLMAQSALRLGFPLDDAWIHQTYARNLALAGEWSFTPGVPSAGSTAPLWSGILTIASLLKIDPRFWTYLVGLAMLALTGWFGARWLAKRNPDRRSAAWIIALLLPLEWHLAWASLSGMETIALGLLSLMIFYLLERQDPDQGRLGLLIGLGVWLRPEALLLSVAPLGALLFQNPGGRMNRLIRFAIGLAMPLLIYAAFQRWLSGEWWPNTFFAKQAEYASLRSIPILTRFLAQIGIPGEWLGAAELDSGGPLIGALLVLTPGLLIAVRRALAAREWGRMLPLAWCLGHLAAYAVRLPVTYQHGRYAMPVIPALVVLAADGMLGWLDLRSAARPVRMLSQAWLATTLLIAVAFWVIGADAYAREVAFVESEMVDTARWINANTPPESLVAVHDIGAIGYFSERELVDLAGLVSPEVIPILRDESALADYLDDVDADFLVTFPGWYPTLVSGKQPVFVTGAEFSPRAGGENMAVYRWK